MTLRLLIKPIEAPHLTRGMVGGIDVISTTYALHAPLLSTVVGLLANVYCEATGNTSICNLQGLTNCLDSLKKAREEMGLDMLWGPLVVVNNKRYFIAEDKLVPIDKTKDYADRVVNMDCAEDCLDELLGNEQFRFGVIEKAGIAIDRERFTGTVKPGFMYRQRFTWLYRIHVTKDERETRRERRDAVEGWGYEYVVKVKNEDVLKGTRYIMRFGGEGRQAIVEVTAGGDVDQGGDYGIVLSPVIFTGDAPFVNVQSIDNDIELVYGLLTNGGVKQRVSTASLGFSEAARCRRPIYPAIPLGTVIRLRAPRTHVGLFTEFGYGSILTVK